jgi:DNA-binding NarL/FixJ family response regulator
VKRDHDVASTVIPARVRRDRDPSIVSPTWEECVRRCLTPLLRRIAATESETLLLIGVARGLTSFEIGRWLHWSVNTVEKYATYLHRRMGVNSSREMMGIVVTELITRLEAKRHTAGGGRVQRLAGA